MSEDVKDICQGWWAREITAETGPARKTRAELRRADTALKALGVPAVHRLNAALERVSAFQIQVPRLAVM